MGRSSTTGTNPPSPGSPPPPYTVYYSLGGKMVAMRRANQQDPSTNGQYRIVGDHLGSTSLILDTASPPNVVQRTYYKPYGEVAQNYGTTTSTSLTSVGYTGQRLDSESGLMYYGARFYDPVLSSFVSADTIAPNPGDPKSRNRFSYALNDPIVNVDPTGHQSARHDDPLDSSSSADKEAESNYEECKKDNAKACRAVFDRLGIDMVGWDWSNDGLWEIQAVLRGMHDLLEKANWTYGDFRNAMGVDKGHPLTMERVHSTDSTYLAFEDHDYLSGRNTIHFYDNEFIMYPYIRFSVTSDERG